MPFQLLWAVSVLSCVSWEECYLRPDALGLTFNLISNIYGLSLPFVLLLDHGESLQTKKVCSVMNILKVSGLYEHCPI